MRFFFVLHLGYCFKSTYTYVFAGKWLPRFMQLKMHADARVHGARTYTCTPFITVLSVSARLLCTHATLLWKATAVAGFNVGHGCTATATAITSR